MDSDAKGEGRHARLIKGLDQMVRRGRVTPAEAHTVRAARDPDQVDAAVVGIRVRHATAKLEAAVDKGAMTREEADNVLGRLRAGEHPRGLRARLDQMLRGG